MQNVTTTLKYVASPTDQPCGVCGATFVPAEDSGSRVLSLKTADVEFSGLMCGGCASKWAHGKTVTLRRQP